METRESILRIIVVALLIYSLAHLSMERTKLYSQEMSAQRLSERLEALEAQRTMLRQRADWLQSDEAVRKLAWERLGMVMPEEIIFYFTDREG